MTQVRENEKVFDGEEFVNHEGCHYSGHKDTIETFGIRMTPDHKLLVDNNWVEAKDVKDSKSAREKATYEYEGTDRYLSRVFKVRSDSTNIKTECGEAQQVKEGILLPLYRRSVPSRNRKEDTEDMEGNGREGRRSRRSSLRRKRNRYVSPVEVIRELPKRHAPFLQRRTLDRKSGCEWGLLQGELQVDSYSGAGFKPNSIKNSSVSGGENDLVATYKEDKPEQRHTHSKTKQWNGRRPSSEGCTRITLQKEQEKEDVYDLVNCGPRNRFVIRNSSGEVFISHNSAGHGLNIQFGGSVAVWFGLTWSLELYQQFNARLKRRGQKASSVIINHLIIRDSIEERLVEALNTKDITQQELLNTLRREV